ncbi:MAG: ABC transporter ATP-binding protein [Verrucomicrobia bacterium]|jgi:predicted ABC-type transport system involved in lysophospholipase L1 biosynthesis ATPase subunit|nr:ABC transporter ATP-binding protein [Verrucomicrobiota bacterium]
MNRPEQPLLEARQVSKSYVLGRRSLEVLKGIDLQIGRGEFLALRGASGAGKSTLLHLLGGLDDVSSGEVLLEGQRLSGMSRSQLSRLRNGRVGFIFQAYLLLPELDALENVCLPARMARTRSADCQRRAQTLLERVGLGQRLDHKPYELSGGEQQRVAIARALINEPDVILADEPTGNLDSRTGQSIVDLLCEIQQESRAALIIATHDARLAARAPRMIELLDGRMMPGSQLPG